jgi:hypothetical protein
VHRQTEAGVSVSEAWCAACDWWQPFDVLPGHPETRGQNGRVFGAIPSFAFCIKCGWQMDIDLEVS